LNGSALGADAAAAGAGAGSSFLPQAASVAARALAATSASMERLDKFIIILPSCKKIKVPAKKPGALYAPG
jgi:hypothetical protein